MPKAFVIFPTVILVAMLSTRSVYFEKLGSHSHVSMRMPSMIYLK